MTLICASNTTSKFTRELKNNNVPFKRGDKPNHIVVESSPKVRMAIRMMKERNLKITTQG